MLAAYTSTREDALTAFQVAARECLFAEWDSAGVLRELASTLGVTLNTYLPRPRHYSNAAAYSKDLFQSLLNKAVCRTLQWQRTAQATRSAPPRKIKHYWCRGEGCHHCNYEGWVDGF